MNDETSRILLTFSEENPPLSWWKLAVDNVDYLAGLLARWLQISNTLSLRCLRNLKKSRLGDSETIL